MCEGSNRQVSRTETDGSIVTLVDCCQGKRLNRPNDSVCRSDGSLYFSDPGMRVPAQERELESSPVSRVGPGDTISIATAECEYPKGLAIPPMNTRYTSPIRALACPSTLLMSNLTAA
jgi:gluconolactonase